MSESIKKRDFLLEIGCEEIPASYLQPGSEQMANFAEKQLKTQLTTFDKKNIFTYYTPRRLIIWIKDLPETLPEFYKTVNGPPIQIAYDANGNFTKAAEGFAKKQGVPLKDLEKRNGRIIANIKRGGGTTYGLFDFLAKEFVDNIYFPKTMRWEESGFRFARPIRWILALFGDQVVKFQIADIKSGVVTKWFIEKAGLNWSDVSDKLVKNDLAELINPTEVRFTADFDVEKSDMSKIFGENISQIQPVLQMAHRGNYTFGHRFLAPEPIGINDPADYFKKIKNASVVIDAEDRRKRISEQLTKAAKKHGVRVDLDLDLIAETANLVEYPVVSVGHFDKSFLEVPAPVLITAMKKHQRYFPFYAENGNLEPLFATVNNLPSDEDDLITHGNEKVLRARLADAQFFFEDDKKRPLEELADGLKKVVFQEDLGSVFEKCERLEHTVHFLGDLLKCQHITEASRAAKLCKADLLTSMVYEFPELQGIMGREYAKLSGEPVEVAEAIYEHYLPRFNGDELPKSDAGALLSLAEKLDNLTGCISVGLIPTSSQDPYGLRRQALAIVQIILHFEYQIPLKKVIDHLLSHLNGKVKEDFDKKLGISPQLMKSVVEKMGKLDDITPTVSEVLGVQEKCHHEPIISKVMEQLKQRLQFVLEKDNIPYDVINSVLSEDQDRDDLMDMYKRAQVIVELRKEEGFSSMMTTHRRVVNILKSEHEKVLVNPDLFADDAESVLMEQLLKIKDKFSPLLDENNYTGAFEVLKPLQPDIDKFFDQVMVMVEDVQVKGNRFALLQEIADLFNQLADFSQIVIA